MAMGKMALLHVHRLSVYLNAYHQLDFSKRHHWFNPEQQFRVLGASGYLLGDFPAVYLDIDCTESVPWP